MLRHPTDPDGGYCHARENPIHYDHWWDGGAKCCECGHGPAVEEDDIRSGETERTSDRLRRLIAEEEAERVPLTGK